MTKIDAISLIVTAIIISNIIFIGLIIFFERKKPVSALAWILTLILLPDIGFFLYILLGSNVSLRKKKFFKLKRIFDQKYGRWISRQLELLDDAEVVFNDENINEYRNMIRMHLKHSESLYTQDNDLRVFTHASEKYDALIKDIRNARETINMLYYIIRADKTSRNIIRELTDRAKQGVEVRILYDEIGSILTPYSVFDDLIRAGGIVRSFLPSRFGVNIRANYRNHRKIVVIDGKIGYTGGMNIGSEYLGFNKKVTPWRDTHLRITGTSVQLLQMRFLMDWYYAVNGSHNINEAHIIGKFFPPCEKQGKTGVQIVSSGPDTGGEQIKLGYIKMINSAKKSIYIQTPYFIPDDVFMEALKIAAISGVDVRVMIPGKPDKRFVYRATTSYVKDLLDCGIKVYAYNGFLHSKMLVMDNTIASIGTANIDIRSFVLDFEVNAFIYDTEFSKKCMDIFENDMKNSSQITIEIYNQRSLWIRLQEAVFRLMSPVL